MNPVLQATRVACLVTMAAVMLACSSAPVEEGGQPSGVAGPTGQADSGAPGAGGAPSGGPAGAVDKKPLAAPSAGGQTLFTRLAPEETGIVGQNILPPEESAAYIFLSGGVATGDYDGDGLVDLYLVSATGSNHLYQNQGNWKFADVTETQGVGVNRNIQTGPWPKRFSVGAYFFDADNDADLDLLVTNFAGPNSYFRNDGGKFVDAAGEAGLDYAGASTTAAFADYDRDGDVDLFVATYRPYRDSFVYPFSRVPRDHPLNYDLLRQGDKEIFLPEKDLLYRNNGDGTFTNVADQAGVGEHRDWGLGCDFEDVTGDGWPDIYVANDFVSPDRFYVNNRDGTFSEMSRDAYRHGSMFSMGMDMADFDNDGDVDYMTSDMAAETRLRRQSESMDPASLEPVSAEMEMTGQLMRNGLYLNNGNGTFSDIAPWAGVMATEWTWSVKFADIDLDGFQDLLVTNGFIRDEMNLDLQTKLNQLQGQNKTEEANQLQRSWPRLLTNDFAFRNEGGLRFKKVSDEWGFNDSGAGYGLGLADFDGDGDLDAVVNNLNDPVAVLRNEAANQRVKVQLSGGASNRLGLGSRLTLTDGETSWGARDMSVSGGYASSHEAVVVFGLGERQTAARLTIAWPSGHKSEVEDVEAGYAYRITEPDGETSLAAAPTPPAGQFEEVAAAAGAAFTHREAAFDDFKAQKLLPYGLSRLGPGVAWGDQNGDGWDDLYVSGGSDHEGGLFVNQAGKGFAAGKAPAPPGDGLEERAALWWPSSAGRASDLLTSLSSVEAVSATTHTQVRRVDAAGNATWSEAGAASAGPLAAADYNADGQLDLFVGGMARPGAYPLATTSRLLRGKGGALEDGAADAPGLAGVGVVNGALWADVDGDGDADLLAATEWGPVKLFANEGGKLSETTTAAGLDRFKGRWHGLAAGDVDHDGDLDVVATNLGLNTHYRPTDAEPMVLLAGDIDPDLDPSGDVEIIEAEWDGGRLYPTRQGLEVAGDVGQAMTQFTNFTAYAKATLEEVFAPDRLKRLERFEANWLAHTLFVNDGSGRFAAKALPDAAQLSVGYGLGLVDADNDGHDDIYIVGNLLNTEPMHVGAWESGIGVLLRGDGKGGFAAVPAAQSGLSVPADAKGLAVTDYDQDGWADLAVGVNGGALRVFHNRGIAGRTGLVVRLQGAAGNPTGVGARITVTRADGLAMTREVHGGGSYLSQDGTSHVFGLGDQGGPATVAVRWPEGGESKVEGAKAGAAVVVTRR